MIKPTELKRLLKIGQSFNLKSLSIDGVTAVFNEQKPKLQLVKEPFVLKTEADLEAKMPPDDEMLFASTPYFDELQIQRKEN